VVTVLEGLEAWCVAHDVGEVAGLTGAVGS
jgi:hypothetical protein